MRVLHVTPYFSPASGFGGPPLTILGLCRALARRGVEVDVVTTTASADAELPACPSPRTEDDGIEVSRHGRRFPRRYFAATGLRGALETRVPRSDLVHVHGLWNVPAWTAAAVARRCGVPYAVSPRGMLSAGALRHRPWKKRWAWLAVERRSLARASFLHATSADEAVALEAAKLGPRVVMLPNGVDVPPRGPRDPAKPAALPAGRRFVGFVGRLHAIKRLDLLVAAFATVHGARSDVHLVLAGSGDAANVRRLQAGVGLPPGAVHLLGEVEGDAKEDLFARLSALVLCSDSESFGLVVAEAMARGVPVVVTRTCPWQEVETVGCGRWVEQRPDAIAEALLQVLDDPGKAAEMGERGRRRAAQAYAWDAIAASMEAEYARSVRERAALSVGGA